MVGAGGVDGVGGGKSRGGRRQLAMTARLAARVVQGHRLDVVTYLACDSAFNLGTEEANAVAVDASDKS